MREGKRQEGEGEGGWRAAPKGAGRVRRHHCHTTAISTRRPLPAARPAAVAQGSHPQEEVKRRQPLNQGTSTPPGGSTHTDTLLSWALT